MNKSIFLYIGFALTLLSGIVFGISYQQLQKSNNDAKQTTSNPVSVSKTKEPQPNRNQYFKALPSNLNEQENQTIKIFEEGVESVAYISTANLTRNRWTLNVTEIPRGSGTGFFWDNQGHIVTNYHVIQGADIATVSLHDQTSYEAKVIGVAPNKDLAVLKINAPAQSIRPIPLGKSHDLKVGQNVFAIGNPFGLDYSLTTGIISALGREIKSVSDIVIKDVIQTDAAINPGNSGGPLLNSTGQLIGVNTAIFSPSGAYAGIGFSIPVDVLSYVVPDLIKYGYVKKPVLGIEFLPNNQRLPFEGSLVINVVPGKGAANAGIKGTKRDRYGRIIYGDIIIGIDSYKITNNSDLVLALEHYQVGDKVDVHILRDGKTMTFNVTLSEN